MDTKTLAPQLIFARAASLARQGDYAAAQALLVRDGAAAKDVASYDLLARIRAQQGDLLYAARLWQAILRRDPTHPDALAGLRRTQQRSILPTHLLRSLLLLGAVMLAVLILGRGLTAIAIGDAKWREQSDARLRSMEGELKTLSTKLNPPPPTPAP